MRRGWAAVLLVVLLLAATPPPARAHPAGNPNYVNRLLDTLSTPDLRPGDSGPFLMRVTNAYPWNMSGITLRFEIYRYREIDVTLEVGAGWTGGPSFVDEFGIDHGLRIEPLVLGPNRDGVLAPGDEENVTVTVVTSPETRHGGFLNQGAYFVRALLDFTLWDGTPPNRTVMMSRGYFTNAQLVDATLNATAVCAPTVYCEGSINLTALGRVQTVVPGLDHLDGVLPETTFSVREEMPVWPFLAVAGVMVAAFVFAVLFHVEENPGKYPRLARWWMSVKGKARGVRRPRSK